MVVSVEAYVGVEGEDEGIKLEEQVLVTEQGIELLSHAHTTAACSMIREQSQRTPAAPGEPLEDRLPTICW